MVEKARLKNLLLNRFFGFFLLLMLIAGCSQNKVNIEYDKDIKTFKFEKSLKKASVGIVYFSDSRPEFERLGADEVTGKSSLRSSVTKLSEEMLLRAGVFSSVTIITSFELPDFYDEKSLERYKKSYDVDYLLGGEILEAKLVRMEKKTSLKYKTEVFLSRGTLPETYYYVAKVRLRGKLVSVKDGKIVWEGTGKSDFMQTRDFHRRENVFIAAVHNALGQMLSNMSKSFVPQIKELE